MRSNRQLTQFAVDRVKGLLLGATDQSAAGNTPVERDDCDCCESPSHIVVRLFGEEIIRFYTSPLNNRIIVGALVSAGNFYDSKGRPSRTTRERLNGPAAGRPRPTKTGQILLPAVRGAGGVPSVVRAGDVERLIDRRRDFVRLSFQRRGRSGARTVCSTSICGKSRGRSRERR